MTPSRSVTGSSTDEVRGSLYPVHGREADTGTGRGNDFGVSVRTVRRWEDRYEADGAEGFYDRRLGKLANTVERHSGMCMPFNCVDLVRQQIPGLFAKGFP